MLKRSARDVGPSSRRSSHKLGYSERLYSAASRRAQLHLAHDSESQHRNESAGDSVVGVLLPALVRWLLLRWGSLVAVQASLGRVLGVVLLGHAALGMVERRIPVAPELGGLLGLLRLAKATLLLTLSLVAVELGRRKC